MEECLKVGTKVKFNDLGGRGESTGKVVEIIYIVKRDIMLPGEQGGGFMGQIMPNDWLAICAKGNTPEANKKLIYPLQITGITMEGGRRGNRKTRKTARRNNRRYSRRN